MTKCNHYSQCVRQGALKRMRYAIAFLLPLLAGLHPVAANTAFAKRASLWVVTALILSTTQAGELVHLHDKPCATDAFVPNQDTMLYAHEAATVAPCMRVMDEAYAAKKPPPPPQKEVLLEEEHPLLSSLAPIAALHTKKTPLPHLLSTIPSHLIRPTETAGIRWRDNQGNYLVDSSDLSTDAIIGIVFASFFCVYLSVGCCYYYWWRDILVGKGIIAPYQPGFNEEVPTDMKAAVYTNDSAQMTVLTSTVPSELEE